MPGGPADEAMRFRATGLLSQAALRLVGVPGEAATLRRSVSTPSLRAGALPSLLASGHPRAPSELQGRVKSAGILGRYVSSDPWEGDAVNGATDAGNARPGRGPSQAACRENRKSQWCALQMERQADIVRSSCSTSPCTRRADNSHGVPDVGTDSTAARMDAFHVCASAVDNLIEDLSRSARLEHLVAHAGCASKADVRQLEERRKALRRQEIEQRRALKRERDKRDPQRSVELKIQSKRSYNNGTPPWAEVPMQKVDVVRFSGTERVSLVDVRLLRSRCQQLEQGATVASLMESQRQRAKQERLMATCRNARDSS